MFIRKRNTNWSLERAVYKPAIKDAHGNIITHPVRTTEYIGSVNGWSRYENVARDLLEKLSDEEKLALRQALKANDPKPDYWFNQLDSLIRYAADDLKVGVELSSDTDVVDRKRLEAKMRAIDDAWLHFFKTAQECGLKRKLRRPAKGPSQAETVSAPEN